MKNLYLIFILSLFVIFQGHSQQFKKPVQKFISVSDTVVAITNVTIIDGTGGEIKKDQTLVISNGYIRSVGDASKTNVPAEAKIIEGNGKTVIPGLVMLHEHLFYSKPFENWFSIDQMTFTFPRLYLAGGVTTIRTGGSIQPQTDLNIKEWIKEGKMTGPKMDVTSPFIEREGYEIPELGFIQSTDEIAKLVNYWAVKGVTSFKLYNHITREDLKICVQEAHKRGLKVTGHLCSITYEEASNMGIDNLEHGFMVASDFIENKQPELCDPFKARSELGAASEDSPVIDALISLLIKNGTAITTTPVVFEPYTDHEIVPGGGIEALAPMIREDVKMRYKRRVEKDSAAIALFNKNLKWVKRFHDQGGLLLAGTDPTGAGRTVAGYANQRTVEILVEAGFSLADAIKICSLNGAIYLEKSGETGTVEAGKRADLVLIDGDLEMDVKNIRKMEVVFKDGVGFDSKKMFESVKGLVGLY